MTLLIVYFIGLCFFIFDIERYIVFIIFYIVIYSIYLLYNIYTIYNTLKLKTRYNKALLGTFDDNIDNVVLEIYMTERL